MESSPISIVIPTLDEIGSLPGVINSIDDLLLERPDLRVTELVIVDDGSIDGTRAYVRELVSTDHSFSVRPVFRDTRRGSADAELEGFKHATNEFVVKLDADGQHPVASIAKFVDLLSEDVDLVIGSRYVEGGGSAWAPIRGVISRLARQLARILISKSREAQDPISGFFLARRQAVIHLDPRLSRYKLLLHILAANPNLRLKEVPIMMGDRTSGSSKIVGASLDYVVKFLIELLGYWRLSLRPMSPFGAPSYPTPLFRVRE
jgi:dolichol-phosphate mannosyltransferase